MKHAVIFDIDGTLLDSSTEDDRIYREAVISVLGELKLRSGLADYDCITDTGILMQVLADNSLPEDAATFTRVKESFFAGLQQFIANRGPFVEIPGAKDVLGRLSGSDSHRVAIATGGWRQSAEMKLASAGFEFDRFPLASSDDGIQRTDIMRTALSALGGDFASVTYFGDGTWDEEACHLLGWAFQPVGPALNGILSYEGLYLET